MKWVVEGEKPVYSWQRLPTASDVDQPMLEDHFELCFKSTFKHSETQTSDDYFVLVDRSATPDVFDPFKGYVFPNAKPPPDEALPRRICSYDAKASTFTVVFADVVELQTVASRTLLKMAPDLVADFLIRLAKDELEQTGTDM